MDALSEILSPVPVEEFIECYFERLPLFVPGPDDKFDHLFRTQDFKNNLDKVGDIRAVFPLLRQAHIGIVDIPDMLRAGASICVTGMEAGHETLGRMAAAVADRLNYTGKVTVRAYLSPQGRGFDMHFDARVASTLQISGKKRWWYRLDPKTRYPKKNSPHTEYLRAAGFDPPDKADMETVLLSPGDFLCIPAGTWHCARAEEDSLALNLAFDHENASPGDCVLGYLKAILDKVAESRRPMYSLSTTPWSDPETLQSLTTVIDDLMSHLKSLRDDEAEIERILRDWFGRRT
jgi:ribosomal protein L16 Arg81 hydroxylase